MRTRRILLPLAVIGILCSGCSLHKPISSHAVDFNLALEKSQNKLMLLNVVRSSKQHPTHYSAISQVLGTASSSLSPTLTLPFGADGDNLFPLSLSASSSGGVATVDIAALNSQDFVQGIMNPISVDQLDYYVKQGWSQELLLALFVRKLVIDGEDFLNRPSADFADVEKFIAKVRTMDITIKSEPGETVGEEFELPKEAALYQLILSGEGAGLVLDRGKEDPKKYRFRRKTGKKALYLSGKKVSSVHENEPKAEDAEDQHQIFFRSTDGVIYYLGQLLRFQSVSDPKPKVKVSDVGAEEAVLFFATEAKKISGESEVEVTHDGVKYVVPKDLGFKHRSMAVLSLINQLLGLNQSRAETPESGVVTVVGG